LSDNNILFSALYPRVNPNLNSSCSGSIQWRKTMRLTLFRNKFIIIGLLVYFVPAFVFWGYVFATTPTHGYYPLDITFWVFVGFFVYVLLFYPMLFLIGHPPRLDWLLYCIVYYAIAYEFLYHLHRKETGFNLNHILCNCNSKYSFSHPERRLDSDFQLSSQSTGSPLNC